MIEEFGPAVKMSSVDLRTLQTVLIFVGTDVCTLASERRV
jgi:hypothetical protein